MNLGRSSVGWALIILSMACGIASWWFSRPSQATVTLPADLQKELAGLDEDAYPEWLTRLYGRLSVQDPAVQTLILQGIPNAPPVVIATVREANGDEQATHWPVPWPGVIEAMSTGAIQRPMTVDSHYHGMHTTHQLIPFDTTGSRCLLVNHSRVLGTWLNLRNVAFVLIGLCGVAILFFDAD